MGIVLVGLFVSACFGFGYQTHSYELDSGRDLCLGLACKEEVEPSDYTQIPARRVIQKMGPHTKGMNLPQINIAPRCDIKLGPEKDTVLQAVLRLQLL